MFFSMLKSLHFKSMALQHLLKFSAKMRGDSIMRRIWSHLAALRLAWKMVHPVDKGLLVFMLLLLAQSTFSMFFPGDAPQLSSDIDVVVRTSSAAIFGYFLSANFVGRHFEKGQAPKEMESTFEDATAEQALTCGNSPIGFCLPDPKSQENQLGPMDGQVHLRRSRRIDCFRMPI